MAVDPAAVPGSAPPAEDVPPRRVVPLGERVEPTRDRDRIFDLFLDWVADVGFELYPAQEEGLLELLSGRHVILQTPTGSGKSLVALGLHFKGLCEGRSSFYTSPTKALASEKFFDLCAQLGAERVGMQTGDAAINPEAGVICCTAEVLANRALRQGGELPADYVVMDEFHYYGDRERGWAWQVPLLVLERTRFLLMSATLGNTRPVAERIEERTGVEVADVFSDERPVPLDYEYRDTPLHETVETLLEDGKAPIYVVSFTHRECAELAQSLTSVNPSSREERKEVRSRVADFRFDTPYGKKLRRLLGFGVAVHHAGLLPKYRLLVEQLAQTGLLKVICGTDTLGVGVNIPIRTVLFTKLAKFDGREVGLLSVRDFKQIAGRAGRKGFDDEGSVVCQAPEHVIESRRRAKKGKKPKGPPQGKVSWNEDAFRSMIERPPETLRSRFRVTHGMVVDLLQRDAAHDDPARDNFASLRELISRSHESPARQRRILSHAAALVRSLWRAGVVTLERDERTGYRWVVVDEELQWDFSLFQTLALYLVESIGELDPEAPDYHLDVLTQVEAVLEDPKVVLYAQVNKLKGDLVARLKADGVPYEERMERLEEVTHPRPNREWIEETFAAFRRTHPWVGGEDIRPKSVGREMFEQYLGFDEYVRQYKLERAEGVLLRYLSQLYKTLSHTVPERARTEGVYDVLGFFRTLLDHTDTSLIDEWESLLHPEVVLDEERREEARRELRVYELLHDPRAFAARVRAELHELVRLLARGEWEEAAAVLRQQREGDEREWPPERLEEALAELAGEHGELVFDARARAAHLTRLEQKGPRRWQVSQVLVSEDGPTEHALFAEVDLARDEDFERPLLGLIRIGV